MALKAGSNPATKAAFPAIGGRPLASSEKLSVTMAWRAGKSPAIAAFTQPSHHPWVAARTAAESTAGGAAASGAGLGPHAASTAKGKSAASRKRRGIGASRANGVRMVRVEETTAG